MYEASVYLNLIDNFNMIKEPATWSSFNLGHLKSVQVISMKEIRGFARCTASGLRAINEKEDFGPCNTDGCFWSR